MKNQSVPDKRSLLDYANVSKGLFTARKTFIKRLVRSMRSVIVRLLLLLYGSNHGLNANSYAYNSGQFKELIQCLFFQKIIRINSHVPWPVHYTSRVGNPKNIYFDKRYVRNFMAAGCYWQLMSPIHFKGSFLVAQHVSFISNNHDSHSIGSHDIDVKPIIIGDNCLFSIGCVVLPGVELGENTVVAANSVVTKSFPEGNCVLAGVPARIVNKLVPSKIKKGTYKEFWG